MKEHDGCNDCRHESVKIDEFPCSQCRGSKKHGTSEYNRFPDRWEPIEEEKNKEILVKALELYCSTHNCGDCALYGVCNEYKSFHEESLDNLEKLHEIITEGPERPADCEPTEWRPIEEQEKPDAPDMVNHPSHYTECSIECIEAMMIAFGHKSVSTFCLLNAFKYLWRHDHKGKPEEDLRKARWYYKFIDHSYLDGDLYDQYDALSDVIRKHSEEFENV